MSSQLSEFEGEPAKPVDKEELENDDEDDGRRRMHAKTSSVSEKDRKIGHRRINEEGQVSYKKIETNQLMASIQLGIHNSVGGLAKYPERDLLMQDFMKLETVQFPKGGGTTTPKHSFSDFTFRTYAPVAFRYFRDLFGIKADDFMISICNEPMRELSNPGASGSIFYLTRDDEFILKTVMFKEAEFLQKLLAGYYMNLQQNPHTLLPKFFGMFCYQCNQKNIRLIVMNNLLPSCVKMHLKFDLKGSTYKRKANKHERSKKSPTFKDLDFDNVLPEGILLEPETYTALISTMRRDCRVLESFKIMDYSLLVGVHNLDLAARERAEEGADAADGLKNLQRQRLVAHSTAMESIQATSDPVDIPTELPPGGIPARNHKGERLLIYLGLIDILQSYRFRKKLEHTFKAMIHDGDTVSVHRPGFYAERFMDFMAGKVFRKIPSSTKSLPVSALKNSPSKRKSLKAKVVVVPSQQPSQPAKPLQYEGGGGGSRPDVVPDGSLALQTNLARPKDQSRGGRSVSLTRKHDFPNSLDHSPNSRNRYISGDVVSVSDIKLEPRQEFDTPSKLSVNFSSGRTATPTWTEGTPSFTESTLSEFGDPVTPAPIRRSEPNSVVTAEWRGDQHAGGEQEYPGLQSYHETEMVSEPGTETLM